MNTDINATRTLPAYRQIQAHIEQLISDEQLNPGDRIPSERALAEQLKRNRMTVRKAIDGLVAHGLLERNGASGTRIPAPRLARGIATSTPRGIGRKIGDGGGVPSNKLLHFLQTAASEKVAKRLEIPEGTDIVVISRVWRSSEKAVCIETSHLPLALVPDLAAEDLIEGQSLYEILHSRYGINTSRGETEVSVTTCTEVEGRLLELEVGTACLGAKAVVRDGHKRPVEYTRSINHPTLVVFKVAPEDSDTELPGETKS